jgi:hypothetical protein
LQVNYKRNSIVCWSRAGTWQDQGSADPSKLAQVYPEWRMRMNQLRAFSRINETGVPA